MFKFSQQLFFKLGATCFGVVALSSTFGLFIDWSIIPTWLKVSRLGSLVFNYGLAYFFYWLAKNNPEQESYYQMTEEEVDNFIKEQEVKNE